MKSTSPGDHFAPFFSWIETLNFNHGRLLKRRPMLRASFTASIDLNLTVYLTKPFPECGTTLMITESQGLCGQSATERTAVASEGRPGTEFEQTCVNYERPHVFSKDVDPLCINSNQLLVGSLWLDRLSRYLSQECRKRGWQVSPTKGVALSFCRYPSSLQ